MSSNGNGQGEGAPPAGELFARVPCRATADARLSDSAHRVLSAIEAEFRPGTHWTYATNRTLQRRAGGKSAETVRRALRELEALGYITCTFDQSRVRAPRRIERGFQLRTPLKNGGGPPSKMGWPPPQKWGDPPSEMVSALTKNEGDPPQK